MIARMGAHPSPTDTLRFTGYTSESLGLFRTAGRVVIAALRYVIAALRYVIAALRYVIAALRYVIAALRYVIAAFRYVIAALRSDSKTSFYFHFLFRRKII